MSVTVPEYGGCPWPVDTACFTEDWGQRSPTVQERALALASSTLERLVGRRVGNCPVTIRPCKPATACMIPSHDNYWLPHYTAFSPGMNVAGAWINSCGHPYACGCQTVCEVTLPGPVGRIDEVIIDGVVLEATDYRVDNWGILVYTGSDPCPWPADQDLSKPLTEVGTWGVTYLNAYPVDSNGAYAVALLAMEYAKACDGNKCRLPSGVTSIVRQGVAMEITSGAFPGGLTGIREVDAYITLWNPGGLQQGATVWSPDLVTPRRSTFGGTP